MLTARRPGWLSSSYVIEAEGVEIVRLERSWRGTTSLSLAAAAGTYVIDRAWFSGRYTLSLGERVVARADPISRWRSDIKLSGEDCVVTLRRAGWLDNAYSIVGSTGVIGSLKRPGWMSSTGSLDLPASVPVLIQCFALAIVLAREAEAAATTVAVS